METRRLGQHEVSRLGLGLAALGRPAYINVGHGTDFPGGRAPDELERQARAVLDAARAEGIRYVDAARSYGRSEAFLQRWLADRSMPPGEIVVGSKWGYRYVGEWRLDAERHEVKEHTVAALRAQLAESRGLLGPHLALYQVHSATEESGVLEDGAVLDELARLRDGGVLVGVTVSGPRQAATVRRALEITRAGAPLFATVQATWNLLERSAGEALAEAHAARRTVIVKEALANGRLAPRGDAVPGLLDAIARAAGATPDAVALAATLAHTFADVVLLGASTVAQLASNVRACEVRLPVGAIEELAALRQAPEAYWQRRAGMPWT
jgi:aryl-alcohol dehydrogenase-like predicted oxidoreductase